MVVVSDGAVDVVVMIIMENIVGDVLHFMISSEEKN